MPADSSTVRSFIDGRAVAPRAGGHDIAVVDPATENVLAQLREADAAEVDAAVAAARRAFDHGPWPRSNIAERTATLRRIHDTLQAHADALTRLEVLDTGLPLASVRWQVQRAAHNFLVFAEVASTLAGQTYSQHPGYQTSVTREPRGVAALIAPWNAPLALASMRVATCIAFGNTCVLKPSEIAPLSVQTMVGLLHDAGLPPGVVNLVNGRGHVTGAALVSHPGIDMVAFTGGTATGRAIAATAGRNLKPVILELGGKSANIVFDSADFDSALDGSLLGIYANNGQMCLAGSRILVQRGVADRFIAAFVERARRIRVGPPLDPATELGPLAYRAHYDRVLAHADSARAEGAELLCGGARAPGFDRGHYLQPTAVLAPSNRLRVCQDEIFGPFATLQVFDTLDDAIAIANDSPYGLVGYVWSRQLDEVMRASRDLKAGVVWVNTPLTRELRSHFGGVKESGYGGDGAVASPEFFTQAKSTIVALQPVAMARLGDRIVTRTLYDKLWASHVVGGSDDGTALLYIDRQLLHEVSSPQAFAGLAARGLQVRRPAAHLAVADHAVPTRQRERPIADPLAREQVALLERNTSASGLRYIPLASARHGIVHIIGPELGWTLPGITLVCGDSHTATHGAFGALAFGIGASEVECVLATQTLRQRRARNLRLRIDGGLAAGVAAKDVALSIVARLGSAGAVGHCIEYAGATVAAFSMAERMTVCNMSIEAGARSGLVAPDDTTFAWLDRLPWAPRGALWQRALDAWRQLHSDADAAFDREMTIDAAALSPQVSWGTSPDQVLPVSGRVPDPHDARNEDTARKLHRALDYMGLQPGTALQDIGIDAVFIGSCTNSRIDDLRAAAALLRGRRKAAHVSAIVVPGSAAVARQAVAEGLDRVFTDAGFEWRAAGCSLCVAMNDDRLQPGQRCASTSNRNFEGRQGAGARTHLMSPASAAASALAGHLADPRDWLQ